MKKKELLIVNNIKHFLFPFFYFLSPPASFAFPAMVWESSNITKVTWSVMEFSGLLWFLLWIFRAGVCVLWGYHQPPGGAATSVMFNLLQVDILVFPFPAHCLCDGLVMMIPRSVWCFSLWSIEELIFFLTLCVKRKRAYAISVDHSVPLLFAVSGSSRSFLTCWQVSEERPSLSNGLL